MRPGLVGKELKIAARERIMVERDFERFKIQGLPRDIAAYIKDHYSLDLTGRYGGRYIKIPFGKASGQLSMNPVQVHNDAEAGLGFCVLKTVIAEDQCGIRGMEDWVRAETSMKVESITSRRTGETGYTVTWRGRGWDRSLEDYLAFLQEALQIGKEAQMVVAPSCKYHLPGPDEEHWRREEYEYTTAKLQEAWSSVESGPMILEKDFSPTLAGSHLAIDKGRVLDWVITVPRLIKSSARSPGVHLGLKVMNTMFEDAFQLEVLRQLIDGPGDQYTVDFITYANRLFDPGRVFNGQRGVAYGGPDLSDRNLEILARLQVDYRQGKLDRPIPPISGTGNIISGRIAVEYALAGAESLQMHTAFQLPDSFYDMRVGSRTERTLHKLLFHPRDGLIVWMLHVRNAYGLRDEAGFTRFLDLSRLKMEKTDEGDE